MKQYFVTGTDTNIGKTLVSSILTLALNGCYWKPIESGTADALPEKDQVQQWTNLKNENFFPAVYSFRESIAPSHAAKKAGVIVDLKNCILPKTDKNLIVEGAGGVFATLSEDKCIIDLIAQLNIPAIIVARGTLGTINHTLLTIEALRQRHINIQGIIFNGELNPDNQTTIENIGKVKTLFHVPLFKEINSHTLTDWITSQPGLMEKL